MYRHGSWTAKCDGDVVNGEREVHAGAATASNAHARRGRSAGS